MQGESNHDVGMLEGGSIYIEGNLIKAIGPKADVDKYVEGIEDVQHINAQGKVICPGFIDCHTHVVFGGSRVAEYAIKLTDPRPETLAKFGRHLCLRQHDPRRARGGAGRPHRAPDAEHGGHRHHHHREQERLWLHPAL